jgi:hypothetical protein
VSARRAQWLGGYRQIRGGNSLLQRVAVNVVLQPDTHLDTQRSQKVFHLWVGNVIASPPIWTPGRGTGSRRLRSTTAAADFVVQAEYEQPGQEEEDPSLARASERLIRTIKDIGIRELVRFGLARRIRCGRRILEKICRRELIECSKLREYERRVREYKAM